MNSLLIVSSMHQGLCVWYVVQSSSQADAQQAMPMPGVELHMSAFYCNKQAECQLVPRDVAYLKWPVRRGR